MESKKRFPTPAEIEAKMRQKPIPATRTDNGFLEVKRNGVWIAYEILAKVDQDTANRVNLN